MKKRIGFVLLMVMCMSISMLFAAGSTESATAKGEVAKEISIFHFKSLWLEPWEELMAIYEKETGVKVNSEITGGSSDYPTMLKTKIAAGEVPDIFFIHGISEYELFKDYIEPQNGAAWEANVANFAKDGYTVDGVVIGMPMTIETFGLIYNKDLFAKVGITTAPKTFEELSAACDTLKAAGITPFSTGAATSWVLGQHFANVPMSKRSNMPQYIADLKAGKAKINKDPLMKEWQHVFNLIFSNCAPNPLAEDHQTEVTLFAQGKVAMMLQGNWKEGSILNINPNMNMGLLPIPLGPNDELDGYVLSGVPFFISINAKSSDEVKQMCKDFCTWLVTNPTAQSYIVNQFQGIPAFTNFDLVKLSPLSKEVAAYTNDAKVSMWSFSIWPDGSINDFAKEMQAYIGSKISFDELLNRMQAIWDERLATI